MNSENPNPDPLSNVLREWKVDSAPPPRFNEQVWHRIARAETPSASPVHLIREWLARTLTRPSFAWAYASVLLIVGLTAGLWQARASSERAAETLQTRYVQLVDPYQMPRD